MMKNPFKISDFGRIEEFMTFFSAFVLEIPTATYKLPKRFDSFSEYSAAHGNTQNFFCGG
jgi:hypothetical protein